jgi:Ca2+-binding EF-hand superfamily protein
MGKDDPPQEQENKGHVVTGDESLSELKNMEQQAKAAADAAEARAKAFKELDLEGAEKISDLMPKARELYCNEELILEAQDGDESREERIEKLYQLILQRAKWPVVEGAPVTVKLPAGLERADGIQSGWKGKVVGTPDRSGDVRINWDHIKAGELDEISGFIKAEYLVTSEWVPPEEIADALQRVYNSRTPRARAQQIVGSDAFEYFVLAMIVLSAGFIALEDPTAEEPNQALLEWGFAFNILFTIEFGLKFYAYGPTYLVSAWTILDVGIVVAGWLDYIAGSNSPLRIFRLLRPLRTIQRLPRLKLLVETVINSLPQLIGIVILLAVYFCIFAIIGLQLWQGKWRQRCTTVDLLGRKSRTDTFCDVEVCAILENPFADHDGLSCACKLDQREKCEQGILDPDTFAITLNENAFEWAAAKYGHIDFMSFDSFFDALPIVLHLVTKVGWTDLMNLTTATAGGAAAAYYISGVSLGAYVLVYFFVAVMKEQYAVSMAVHFEGEAAFDRIDTDRNGTLEKDEVKRIFLVNGVFLGEKTIDDIFSKMSGRDGEHVTKRSFLIWLRGRSSGAAKLRRVLSIDGVQNTEEEDNEEVDDTGYMSIVQSAKKNLTRRATVGEQIEWKALFEYYNVDDSGEIDLKHFSNMLRKDAHIHPSYMGDEAVRALFNDVDTDKSGLIGFSEFEEWLLEDEEVTTLEEQTRGAVIDYITKTTCKKLDIRLDDDGFQDFQQMNKAINFFPGASDLIDDLAFSTEKRELFVNYQPEIELVDKATKTTDEEGKTVMDNNVEIVPKGPPMISITKRCAHPLIGHAIRFRCTAGLVPPDQTGMSKRKMKKQPLLSKKVANKISFEEYVPLSPLGLQLRKRVVTRDWYAVLVGVAVALNIAVLCMDHHGMSPVMRDSMTYLHYFFTLGFFGEVVMKLLAFTRHEYWSDGYKIFELVIVLFGLLEVIVDLALGADQVVGAWLFFRGMRVLRSIRLIIILESMSTVIDVVVLCFWDLLYVMGLVFLFLYMFTCMGMMVFGGELGLGEEVARANWDTFTMATMTTFQIMTLDNWTDVLYTTVQNVGPLSIVYFALWIVVGTWVLCNLLLVTLLDAYQKAETRFSELLAQKQLEKDNQAQWDGKEAALKWYQWKNQGAKDQAREDANNKVPTAPQIMCRGLVEHEAPLFAIKSTWDLFFTVLVVFNLYTMAIDKPWLDEDDSTRVFCDVMAPVFTFFFTAEAAIKIFGYGLYKADDSYLSPYNPNMTWNVLDLVVLAGCYLEHMADVQAALGGVDGRFWRLTRSIRALRLLGRFKGLQDLVFSVAQSVSSLISTLGVTCLIWLVFALTAVTHLQGTYSTCSDTQDAIVSIDECVGTYMTMQPYTGIDPDEPRMQAGITARQWAGENPSNFDSVHVAMYTLFEASTLNGWVNTAYNAMDSVAVNQSPVTNNSMVWAWFFMIFVTIHNLFLYNLFIGVIYTKYTKIKESRTEDFTKRQMDWLYTMKALGKVSPWVTHKAKRVDRIPAFKLVTNPFFEVAMMGIIIFNVVVLAMPYAGEPDAWFYFHESLNFLCTLAFTGEMAVKIWAFSWHDYWADNFEDGFKWNRFDCLVVYTSWVEFVLEMTKFGDKLEPSTFRMLRIARVVGRVSRLFKFSKKLESLKMIMDTFTDAMPGMGYVVFFVCIVLYMFGVLGMNLFGQVRLQGCLNDYQNFLDVPTAMLTLFGISTGDKFSCVLHSCMVQETYPISASGCSEADGDCGEPVKARVFFLVFWAVMVFTMITLFIDVVLDRYMKLCELHGLTITREDIEAFCREWQRFDNAATGFIPYTDYDEFMNGAEDEEAERDSETGKFPRVGGIQENCTPLAYEAEAGEEPISVHELRLPERPGGKLSRYMATDDPKAKESAYTYIDKGMHMINPDAQFNFHELLYALCERKAGCPLKPNPAVEEARMALGLKMPTVSEFFEEEQKRQRKQAEANKIKMSNPLMDSFNEDSDASDDDDTTME